MSQDSTIRHSPNDAAEPPAQDIQAGTGNTRTYIYVNASTNYYKKLSPSEPIEAERPQIPPAASRLRLEMQFCALSLSIHFAVSHGAAHNSLSAGGGPCPGTTRTSSSPPGPLLPHGEIVEAAAPAAASYMATHLPC